MKTTFDFEEGGGLVEDLWWKVGEAHDLVASTSALADSLEDFGLGIGVAEEALLLELLVVLDIILGEEFVENVGWLGVGDGTLLDEFIAALRIGVGDVAGDGEDGLALSEGMSGSIEGTGFLSSFDHHYDVGKARNETVAV